MVKVDKGWGAPGIDNICGKKRIIEGASKGQISCKMLRPKAQIESFH